jgi:hypothetical protein
VNSGNWIELAALIVTILGGGGIGVSKVTRIAVAIEALGRALETVGKTVADTSTTVAGHTTQLALHEARITAVEPPKP